MDNIISFLHVELMIPLSESPETFDGRSLAGQRRKLAMMKGTDAMLELIKSAQKAGHTADYVLFDTWFSNPSQLISVKALDLDTIAMIKRYCQ